MDPRSDEDIEAEASRGDSNAQIALARRLLTLPPYNTKEVIKWVQAAAQGGSGEASHLLAVLTGEGFGIRQSFEGSLDHLRLAAERGYPPAQAELAAVAGDWSLAREIASGEVAPPETWSRLRRAVDIAAWLSFPQSRMVSTGPYIAMVDGFLPPAICDWLIALGEPGLKRAQVLDPETGRLRDEDGRSNRAAALSVGELDLVLVLVRARIAALTGLPVSGFEDSQILHYAVGEEFGPHVDFLDVSFPAYAKDVASQGQRAITALVYLNDDFDGGETVFPALGRGYKGGKGGALVFSNVTQEGLPDKRTVHAGSPTTRGEKWLLSQWIRIRPQWLR